VAAAVAVAVAVGLQSGFGFCTQNLLKHLAVAKALHAATFQVSLFPLVLLAFIPSFACFLFLNCCCWL
jgi:hypothetical protein